MKVSIIARNMVKSLTSLYKMIDGQCLGPAKGHKYFMTTLFRIVVFFFQQLPKIHLKKQKRSRTLSED